MADISFYKHVSHLQTITVKRNFETTYGYAHKFKQILYV